MAATINREWIGTEFSKGIDAEQHLADEAKTRAESMPDPVLGVLYNEIAAADARHRAIVETVAIRYGHTPSRSSGSGIGETLSRLKDRVTDSMSSTSHLEKLGHDLAAKANAIHWYTAWAHTFETIGDTASARELSAVLTEEKAHRDALQEGLNRMVAHGAQVEGATESK